MLHQRGIEVVEVLGVGGSSVVYRARDLRHDRDVAVNVLRADAAMDHADERFEREVRVAASVRHMHVLPLFDSGVLSDGRRCAVMPVAQGRPLRALLDEGTLAPADAMRLAREVGEALANVHASGWVHRDVKPENILIEGGHAVLTDFGLAAPVRTLPAPRPRTELGATSIAASRDSRLTEIGHVVGTPAYMSPEAFWSDIPLDERSDLYSLGVVLHEMLAGSLPERSSALVASATTGARQSLPSLPGTRPALPPLVDALIARAVAVDPAHRFQHLSDFLAALAEVERLGSPSPMSADASKTGWLPPVPAPAGASELRRGSHVIVTLVLALAAGVRGMVARASRLFDPNHVVVADFANETGNGSLDRLGVVAGDIITASLERVPSLTILNADLVLAAHRNTFATRTESGLTRQATALAESSRAGILVSQSYFRDGDSLAVVAEVSDTRSGRVLGIVGPERMSLRQAEGALARMAESVANVIRRRYDPLA